MGGAGFVVLNIKVSDHEQAWNDKQYVGTNILVMQTERQGRLNCISSSSSFSHSLFHARMGQRELVEANIPQPDVLHIINPHLCPGKIFPRN